MYKKAYKVNIGNSDINGVYHIKKCNGLTTITLPASMGKSIQILPGYNGRYNKRFHSLDIVIQRVLKKILHRFEESMTLSTCA